MVTGAEIQAGVNSAKSIFDIAKGYFSLKSESEKNAAILSIQREALETQAAYTAALKRIDILEEEIVRLRDWSAEKERYQLKRFYPGSVAYVQKDGMQERQAPDRLCPDCFSRGQKSFLQPTVQQVRRYTVHRCASCRMEAAMGQEMPSEAQGEPPEPTSPPAPPYDRYSELRND